METKKIKLTEIELNEGQIEGLPVNPRQWTKKELESLKRSIKETPELLDARGVIVYPYNGRYIVLGGNMRLSAARELKMESVPCIVVPEGTPVDKLKEIVIKDNGSFGSWDFDMLANEWDDLPLMDWGVPALDAGKADDKITETERLSQLEYDPLYYEPKNKPELKLEQCLNLEKFEKKIKALDEFDLPQEKKELLKWFAYRFIKIDFEAVANYYAFCASEEEKKSIERLRLVLVDNGSINGFIEDDLLKVAEVAYFDAVDGGDE